MVEKGMIEMGRLISMNFFSRKFDLNDDNNELIWLQVTKTLKP